MVATRTLVFRALILFSGLLCCGPAPATGTRTCVYNSDCATPLVCTDTGYCREQCREDRDCPFGPVDGHWQRGQCRNLTYDYDSAGHYVPIPPAQAHNVVVGTARWPARDHDTCLLPNSPYWSISRPPGQLGMQFGGTVSVAPASAGGGGVSVVPAAPNGTILRGVNFPGKDMMGISTPDDGGVQCRASCLANGQCKAFSWVRPGVQGPDAKCWLKGGVPNSNPDPNANSGVVNR